MSLRWRIAGLIALTWLPLVFFAAVGGAAAGGGIRVPLLFDYGVAARFLIAGPTLLSAGTVIRRRVVELHRYFMDSGLVSEAAAPQVERLFGRLQRLQESWILSLCLAVAVVFGTIFLRLEFSGDASSWQFVAGPDAPAALTRSAAGWWYLLVSIPIFQYLLLTWIWRYTIWCWFLFRLSRLELTLVATHPDRSAGLALVGYVHQYFGMVVFAAAVIVSAHVGMELVRGGHSFVEYRPYLGAFLLLSLLVMLGPLLAFTAKLVAVRRRGLLDYGRLAVDYTQAFNRKWIPTGAGAAGVAGGGEEAPLLGSSDIQSLADLSNSYNVVRDMRIVPFDVWTVVVIALSVAVPIAPLAFAVFPPFEIIKWLAETLL